MHAPYRVTQFYSLTLGGLESAPVDLGWWIRKGVGVGSGRWRAVLVGLWVGDDCTKPQALPSLDPGIAAGNFHCSGRLYKPLPPVMKSGPVR